MRRAYTVLLTFLSFAATHFTIGRILRPSVLSILPDQLPRRSDFGALPRQHRRIELYLVSVMSATRFVEQGWYCSPDNSSSRYLIALTKSGHFVLIATFLTLTSKASSLNNKLLRPQAKVCPDDNFDDSPPSQSRPFCRDTFSGISHSIVVEARHPSSAMTTVTSCASSAYTGPRTWCPCVF